MLSSALSLVLFLLTVPMFTEAAGQQQDLLSLDLESLLNIKVTTASKFSEKLSDAPGVISIITKDELKRFGAMSLREALERVPSLVRTSAYFTDRSLVAARGDQTKIDGGHVLILINGRPTREIQEGGLITDLLESFPVAILERIEVIKGPGSVLYGSNAFSAVINLITQKAESNGFVLSGFGGEKGAQATSGQGMLQRGNLSVVAAAQARNEPNWPTTYRFPFVDPLFPETSSVSAQNVTLRDRSKGAFAQLDYKGFTAMSSFTEWHGPSFVRGAVGENRWRRGFGDLGYGFKATDKWDMKLNLTYTRTTLDVPSFPNIGRDSNEVVLEWTNTIKPTDKDQLTIGSLYNHIQGSEVYFGVSPSITISQGARSGAAFYAQLDHRLLDSLKLIGGLQANKIAKIDVNVVPRAGVVWNPTAHVNVKALYSKAFRAPSLNETGLNHPGLQGTPGLVPEKVGTADLGVNYQGRRIQLGVNYFYSKHTDSIIVDSSPLRWRYANLGEATFRGVEFEGKYYLNKPVFLEGSLLYQTNRDNGGKSNLTPIPNIGISYAAENGITAGIFDSYQGRIPGYGSTVNPYPGSYHLLNSHFKFDVLRHLRASDSLGMAIVIHANNLTNRQVWLPEWGGNSMSTMPVVRGRTVYFGFEISSSN
jgi:outer membrane receptor protein involved in Fe transport